MLPAGDLYSKQNSRRDATMSIGLFGDQKFANTLGRKGRKKAKQRPRHRRIRKKGTVSDSAMMAFLGVAL